MTFTIDNIGESAASLGAVTLLSGTSFAVDGGTCASLASLPAQGSCTLEVVFTPLLVGALSDTLRVNYQDGVANQELDRSISGSGVALQNSQIVTGSAHSCILQNGAVKCWGSNEYGQLGNGSTLASRIPVTVSGLSAGVTSIAAGYNHTCAIQNGAMKCWGKNQSGQLGDGSQIDRLTPVAVYGLDSGVSGIFGGWSHTCAIQNGGAKCWGWNGYGQLGDGSQIYRLTPVAVLGLGSGVSAITTGYVHTCAIQNASAKWTAPPDWRVFQPRIMTD